MMTRWTFFFSEGNIRSEVTDQAEDERIGEFIQESPKGLLQLIGPKTDIYVNLEMVKCIACETITQEQMEIERQQKLIAESNDQARENPEA